MLSFTFFFTPSKCSRYSNSSMSKTSERWVKFVIRKRKGSKGKEMMVSVNSGWWTSSGPARSSYGSFFQQSLKENVCCHYDSVFQIWTRSMTFCSFLNCIYVGIGLTVSAYAICVQQLKKQEEGNRCSGLELQTGVMGDLKGMFHF